MIKKYTFYFLLVLLLSFTQFLIAQNRKCFDGPFPPCREYWRAAAIFSGQATNISLSAETIVVRFKTEKFYRGNEAEEIEIHTYNSRSGGYPFQVGERYLVYAYRSEDKLITKACSATKPLDESYPDIGYFDSLARGLTGGSLAGQVEYLNRDFEKGRATTDPKPGVRVLVDGEGFQSETMTDEEGNFRFQIPRAGKFKVTVFSPAGFKPLAARNFNLNNGECGHLQFEMRRVGYIAGHVFSPEGKPVTKGHIYIHSAENAFKKGFSVYKAWFTEIDGSGIYKFEDIPPGRYVIALNPYPGPPLRWDSPYAQTYYPGVPDLEHAAVVILGEEEKLENVDFRMPQPIKQRLVTGTVVYPDGRPGAGLRVHLFNEGGRESLDSVETDADGKFAFTIYEGFIYQVQAEPSPVGNPATQSQSVQLPAHGEITDLKLIIGRGPSGITSQ